MGAVQYGVGKAEQVACIALSGIAQRPNQEARPCCTAGNTHLAISPSLTDVTDDKVSLNSRFAS